jgi:Spy/CpxP family protein refolding chaperone
MKRFTTLSTLALAFALALWPGTAALAQVSPGGGPHGGGWGGRGGHGGMSPFVLRSLNLTPDQWSQVRSAVASHRPNFQALSSQLRDARQKLSDRLVSPGALDPNDPGLQQLVQQISKAREQLGNEALLLTLDIRKILTPDQITKAGEVQAKLRDLRLQMRDTLQGK